MSDDLGDRMKLYERMETARTAMLGIPLYARIDGRCFSNFTRKMDRPYDERLSRCMIETTKRLVESTAAMIGYTQSDEISLAWWASSLDGELPFGGKLFKLTSCLAAQATAFFILEAQKHWPDLVAEKPPTFDCRVFSLPNEDELANVFLWRERDATKNAISMAARAYYRPSEMDRKTSSELQEMMFQKGINFNDYPAFFKRGTFVQKKTVMRELTAEELKRIPETYRPTGPIARSVTAELEMPSFGSVINRVDVIWGDAPPFQSEEEERKWREGGLERATKVNAAYMNTGLVTTGQRWGL